jgi:hypothetical protein
MDDLNRRLSEHGNLLLHDDPLTLEQVRMWMAGEEELAVDPRPRPWGRFRSLAVAVGVGVLVLLLFLPQLLMRAPDEATITEESIPVSDSEWNTVDTPIGVIEWREGPPELPGAGLHRVDGVYYAQYTGETSTWEQSTDGFTWTATSSPLGGLPGEYVGPDSRHAVFDIDGQAWATVGRVEPTSGPMILLKQEGNSWGEAPFESLETPEGVTFVDLVESTRALQPVPTYFTTVISHDGRLMMIRKPDSSGHEMVLLGSEAYALSANDAPSGGFDLWRSSDGGDWSLVDLPPELNGDFGWAHLSAGHGRLMLAVRHPNDSAGALLWTTDDGQNWVEAKMPNNKVLGPVLPRPTDNGWAMYNPGEPNSEGGFDQRRSDLLVSADGVEWERVPYIPQPLRNSIGPAVPIIPIVYEAGLMVRDLTGLRDHSLVGKVNE